MHKNKSSLYAYAVGIAETGMAAYSFLSTYFSSPTLPPRLPSPNRLPNSTLPLSRDFSHRSLRSTCIVASLGQTYHSNHSPAPESTNCCILNKFLDSLVVLITSAALSVSIFVTDVDSAAAFVVTPSRKLQTDELATVRLFQDNTPSVVYITNLAARYFYYYNLSKHLFLWLSLCLLNLERNYVVKLKAKF